MIEGETVKAELHYLFFGKNHLVWAFQFLQRIDIVLIVIKDIPSDKCNVLVNQTKEFSANLNEIKRQPAIKFGLMLP